MEDEPAPSYSTGSGRRQRRQQDPTSEFVEEQDLLPGSGSQTPGSASRSKRKDKSKKRDELDEALERHAAQDFEDEELDDDDLYHDARAFDYPPEAPTDFKYHNRSYDDEDEALQAALKASMADLPPDFEMPELQPLKPAPVKKQSQPAPEKKAAPATRAPEPLAESSRTTTERWRPAEPPEDALQDAPPDTVTEEDDEEPVQELTPGKLPLLLEELTLQRRSARPVSLGSSNSSRNSRRQGTIPRNHRSHRGAIWLGGMVVPA